MESYYDEWKKIMSNESVRETYYYIDWDHLDFVNYKQNIQHQYRREAVWWP